MIHLGDRLHGRDNNFNLIRIVAALGVVVSHAWPLSTSDLTIEPRLAATDIALGHASVYVFFAISGLLIARSMARGAPLEWAAGRFLRIVPGLFVVLVLAAFVLGPALTSLPIGAYLSSPEVATYVLRNLTLVRLQPELPGVFEGLGDRTVNGPLWTLKHEVACYAAVLAAWAFGAFASRWRAALTFLAAFAAYYATRDLDLFWWFPMIRGAYLAFLLGALAWPVRDRLPLRYDIAAALAVLAWLSTDLPFYREAIVVALSYGTFVLALRPAGVIRSYNRLGDYSYGVYIWGWPVQQVALDVAGPLTPVESLVIVIPITLALAVVSWHAVENPALALRRYVGRRAPARRAAGDNMSPRVRDLGDDPRDEGGADLPADASVHPFRPRRLGAPGRLLAAPHRTRRVRGRAPRADGS